MDSLFSDLAALLRNSEESGDITLVCCDGEVKVHGIILAARSTAFNAMLNSDMMEKRSRRVEIKDFRKSIVEAMAKFVYTAQIDETFEDLDQLLALGHKYLIESLVKKCGEKLARKISKDNVMNLGVMAETFSAGNLLKSCVDFVINNMELLGEDLLKLKDYPKLLMSIIRSVKGLRQTLRVSRFEHIDYDRDVVDKSCHYNNKDVESMPIELSKAATLTSVGLFGSKDATRISVKVNIYAAPAFSTPFWTTNATFDCSGSRESVDVPVKVVMDADKEYMVEVSINNGKIGSYWGNCGKIEVNYDDQLTVQFMPSTKSTETRANGGLIRSLCFQLC